MEEEQGEETLPSCLLLLGSLQVLLHRLYLLLFLGWVHTKLEDITMCYVAGATKPDW